jgi:hypothetical protein
LVEENAILDIQLSEDEGSQTDGRFELIFTTNSVVSVGSKEIAPQFSVFPNPSEGGTFNITISNIAEEKAKMVITDILGKEVFTKPITLLNRSYSGAVKANLPAGIYNVELQTSQKRTKKTIVVR